MRNHRRRPALGLALGATVAVVLTGCGGTPNSADEAITLSYWSHTHEPMNVLTERIIEEYEAEHPNVTIEYRVLPNTDFTTATLTALAGGGGPDIVNISDVTLRGDFIPMGVVAPLDPAGFDAESIDDVLAAYEAGGLGGATSADGEVYGVPTEYNAAAFAINAEHFRDAGLDPEAPLETWEDVRAAGLALVAAGHAQAFSFLYPYPRWYAEQLSALMHQTGGSIVSADGTESTLSTPESMEAIELWTSLADGTIGDPHAASRDSSNPYADFASGTQSMALVYPWAMEQIEQSNPEVYENLQVVPLPQVNPDEPVTHGYGYYLAVGEHSDHQEEAWRFVAHMASYSEDWLSEVSFVQPVVDWSEGAAAQELAFVDAWAEAYATVQFANVSPRWVEVQEAIQTMINQVVFDGGDLTAEVERANDAIDQSISG